MHLLPRPSARVVVWFSSRLRAAMEKLGRLGQNARFSGREKAGRWHRPAVWLDIRLFAGILWLFFSLLAAVLEDPAMGQIRDLGDQKQVVAAEAV